MNMLTVFNQLIFIPPLYGNFNGGKQVTQGKHMENILKTYGKHMENIWKTHGKHMENMWKTQ